GAQASCLRRDGAAGAGGEVTSAGGTPTPPTGGASGRCQCSRLLPHSRHREPRSGVANHAQVPLAACVWIAASAFGLLAMTRVGKGARRCEKHGPLGAQWCLACASSGAAGAGGGGVTQAGSLRSQAVVLLAQAGAVGGGLWGRRHLA